MLRSSRDTYKDIISHHQDPTRMNTIELVQIILLRSDYVTHPTETNTEHIAP